MIDYRQEYLRMMHLVIDDSLLIAADKIDAARKAENQGNREAVRIIVDDALERLVELKSTLETLAKREAGDA